MTITRIGVGRTKRNGRTRILVSKRRRIILSGRRRRRIVVINRMTVRE